ncbi:cobalt-precorrin-5B (C(1))-methyltransferase [Stappia taiwanensis]|uniref:Cobalt-precorrin-5B C(1)-methyltransferase n=1 Tax=Stappia taiwanensis TaxID=992267 RepID=A0A838XQR0_9HYPH|nr:cobalt-precorrin-5B (C(1))-methyltransferase [Stappia taiwanensis]MBA4612602.1 cobalt-precorrin-5B (C(1))-methyltransferase [Stappia taiwanensis]GGE89174.1 cobalt-precorrin-5B C(1)-methyltransferase [Stappia taiwanensis]
MKPSDISTLRRGWTTGACATAAAKSAYMALLSGEFADPVEITLPKGERPAFALEREDLGDGFALAGIVKDAGDDPDVTHGATVIARVSPGPPGSGVVFRAGEGVGTVTRAGLPIPPGEPAINPVPRRMIREAIAEVAAALGGSGDVIVEISIPGGDLLAKKTMNPRLGILGGLSVLGTTGIVRPFSCAAWIASIHRGIDVAQAAGQRHVVGATGSNSEDAVRARHDLPEIAFLDMGDFAGGLLKYLRAHPVERLTLAGGFAKFLKLAQGAMDLHSARSQVDFAALAALLGAAGASSDLVALAQHANTAKEVLDRAEAEGIDIAARVAEGAWRSARAVLRDAPVALEVLVVNRAGRVIGETRGPGPDSEAPAS